MELDDLKIQFRHSLEASDRLQVPFAISKNNAAVVARIRRNILREFAACLVCAGIAVFFIVTKHSPLVYMFCTFAIVFTAVFCIYLFLLLRRIHRLEISVRNVKENLAETIHVVKNFMHLYWLISVGLLPIIFIFGLIAGYIDISAKGITSQFRWSIGLQVYCGAFIAWSLFTGWFARWYIKYLYGDYVIMLEARLKETENG